MASATNDASASASLSSADNPADNSTAIIEQLSEELGIRQAVLASLRDLPESTTTKQEIAAARASIVDLKRQLSEARGRGAISPNSQPKSSHLLICTLLSPVNECEHEQRPWGWWV